MASIVTSTPSNERIDDDHNHNTDNYVDITQILVDASITGLSASNPTIQASHFSLHDSMAALQVGSISMDCCALPLPKLVVPKSLSDLPFEFLTVADVTDIVMNNLVIFEALLNGSNVLESTYTCLYTQDSVFREMHERASNFGTSNNSCTLKAHHFALYTSTVCLLKMSDLVHALIIHADIYEEEDFDAKTLGVTFGRGVVDFDDKLLLSDLVEKALCSLEEMESIERNTTVYTSELSMCLSAQLTFYQICARLVR